MKKNWKIIFGIILIIGGVGLAVADLTSGLIDIAIGAALIVWWMQGRKKSSANHSAVKKHHQPSPVAHAVSQDSRPSVKSEDGYDVVLPEEKASAPLPPSAPHPVTQVPPPSAKSKEKYDVVIPEEKDGAPLAYRYSVPFVPSDLDAVLAAAKAERWYLSAKQIGKEIHLFSEETNLGILTERADMVSDWLKRGEPYLIILERVNSETGCTVMLVFYRDKQKYYANREQTVTALTAFKAEAKQDVLSCLGEGDELELEEEWDKEDSAVVTFMGDAIGRLPKKYAQKYISDGAALVVLDHMEEDDEFVKKPYVRIYW